MGYKDIVQTLNDPSTIYFKKTPQLMDNPYAMYINCDGAMDYVPGSPGGIGFCISFPDYIHLQPIPISIGTYKGANIEMLEIEALVLAMEKAIEVWQEMSDLLTAVNRIILITDRFGLKDDEKTSPHKIKAWRRNHWKNFEGKPIKNHKQLDSLDKTRKKLYQISGRPIEIIYRRRKQNKVADKLAKAGKASGLPITKLNKKGEKIGKRKFNGAEVAYKSLSKEESYNIHVFRKDPVQNEWEVWVEMCDGIAQGRKLKIYADNILSAQLKRRNEYVIKIKEVFRYFVRIYDDPSPIGKQVHRLDAIE